MTDANDQQPPAPAPTDPPAKPTPTVDITALTTELAQAKQQLIKLQSDLTAATNEKEATTQALAALQQQQQQFQTQFGTLQTQLGELTQIKGTLEQQVAQLTGQTTTLDGTNQKLSRQLSMINHIAMDPALLAQSEKLLPLLGTLAIPDTAEEQKKTLELWANTFAALQKTTATDFRQGATNPAQGAVTPPAGGNIFQIPGQQPGGTQPLTPNEITRQMMGVAGMDDKTYEALANQLQIAQAGATKTEN